VKSVDVGRGNSLVTVEERRAKFVIKRSKVYYSLPSQVHTGS